MTKKMLVPFMCVFVFFGCKAGLLGLSIHFDRINGLKKGDRVVFEKNPVGQVTRVVYSREGDYVVEVAIQEAFKNAATENSKFFVVSDPEDDGKKAVEIVQEPKGGAFLADGSHVKGSETHSEDFEPMWDEFSKGLQGLKKQLEQFSEELRAIPESEAFKNLKEELDRLSEVMKETGRNAREKIERDVLPRLMREMEKLRQRLRELGREEEGEPIKTKLKDTRTI